MANMRVAKLPANNAWAVVYGDSLIRIAPDMPMFWDRRVDLVAAIENMGICVVDRKGTLASKTEQA